MRHAKHVTPTRRYVIALTVLGAVSTLSDVAPRPEMAVAVTDGSRSVVSGHKIEVPAGLTLGIDEEKIAAGAGAEIDVLVEARAALSGVFLTLITEGPVEVPSPTRIEIGMLRSGESRSLRIPVRYPSEGRSVVRVTLHAQAQSPRSFERSDALYVILEEGQATADVTGFLNLDLRRVDEALEAGTITEEEAQAARRALKALPVTVDDNPRPTRTPTEQEAALERDIDPVAEEGETYEPDEMPDVVGVQGEEVARGNEGGATGGFITVQGTVSWLDELGTSHPVFGMTVQVRDEELFGTSELVAEAITGTNGQYSFVVLNDDGFLAGNRDIFVRTRTVNTLVSIEPDGAGGPYEGNTAVTNEVPDGTVITENITVLNTGNGPSSSVLTGATYIASYTKQLNGGVPLAQLRIEWPGTSSAYDNVDIDLLMDDRWDWDVLFHEYGHYVTDTFNFESSPGGPHSFGSCLAAAQPSKEDGLELAWGEGWPTYFGTSGQQVLGLVSLNVPRVGDVRYTDTIDSTLDYSLETQDTDGVGEDNETAVQRLFWDLFDSAADGRDAVQMSDQTLFDLVDDNDATILSAAWAALRTGLTNAQDLAIGRIASDHAVGPDPQSPATGSIVPPGTTFTWDENVGCDGADIGNQFDLVFYEATTLAKLLTLPGISSPSRTLSLAEYQTLIASTRTVRWAVEGRNTAAPASGPYLGDNRTCMLNRPPTCNADGPYAVECALPITLDGSGSSDPDGDGLTFSWSGSFAPSPATNAQPSVEFAAVGDFPVALAVSDGIQTATCSSIAMVRDTIPPVIPPDPPVAECASPAGTAVDIGIPSDLCDPNIVYSNDAPSLFPLGSTTVNWTAEDASGNEAIGTQTVTVADTTPPTISVTASPDILWPPNHTLRTVHLTVNATDACDGFATVRLLSIVSSEDDKDPNDVTDRSKDIQGAKLGTDDRTVRLRAEHSKGGARTYTITYAAEDTHGNQATAQAEVRVPKSVVALISRNGHPANGASSTVAVNKDATFVAFSSDATNLVRHDTNERRDVFVRDRELATTERVSVSSTNAQANGPSDAPSINGDGTLVAFSSAATNLVSGDHNARRDIFVRDRNAGTTERVSVTTTNVEANGSSNAPSIDQAGRFVAFQSTASDLVTGDINDASDIFVRDRLTQMTTRLCGATEGDRFSFSPAISADGRFVAFTSAATNLIAGDSNGRLDIFVCDRTTDTLERVSVSSGGEQGNRDSLLPAISSDGRFVAFKSLASNLVPDDHNGVIDVFVRDRLAGITERVSVDTFGGDPNDASFPPSISYDGRFVAFGSFASDLVGYDTNDVASVFVRDRDFATTYLADVNDNGDLANRGVPDRAPSISGDGVQVGFVSPATNLVANPNNEVNDVFIVCNPALPTPPSLTIPPTARRHHSAVAFKKSVLLRRQAEQ